MHILKTISNQIIESDSTLKIYQNWKYIEIQLKRYTHLQQITGTWLCILDTDFTCDAIEYCIWHAK